MAAAIAIGSAIAGRALGRVGARRLLIASALLTAAALGSPVRINPESTYLGVVLPAFVLAGLGLGIAFVALTTAAVGSAPASDSGIAAALFTTGQQVGGAVGLAVLTSVATTRTINLLAAGVSEAEAVSMGWSLGFVVCVGLVLAGLLITLTMIRPAPLKSHDQQL
jgi:MFS family permease